MRGISYLVWRKNITAENRNLELRHARDAMARRQRTNVRKLGASGRQGGYLRARIRRPAFDISLTPDEVLKLTRGRVTRDAGKKQVPGLFAIQPPAGIPHSIQ